MQIVRFCRDMGRFEFCEQGVRTTKESRICGKVPWRILMLDTSCDPLHWVPLLPIGQRSSQIQAGGVRLKDPRPGPGESHNAPLTNVRFV